MTRTPHAAPLHLNPAPGANRDGHVDRREVGEERVKAVCTARGALNAASAVSSRREARVPRREARVQRWVARVSHPDAARGARRGDACESR
eukprot:2443326-Prymnesium_polylepis.1